VKQPPGNFRVSTNLYTVTDVGRLGRHTTIRQQRIPHSRWALSTLALVAVFLSTVIVPARPAHAAGSLQEARAKAAALYKKVQHLEAQASYLGQKYNLAQMRYATLTHRILNSRAAVEAAQRQVKTNRDQLKRAAVNAYINAGAAALTNPLFAGPQDDIGARKVYNQIAEGDMSTTVASLQLSSIQLTSQRQVLRNQQLAAKQTRDDAAAMYQKALKIQRDMQHLLNGAQGQVAYFVRKAQEAAERAAYLKWKKTHKNEKYYNYPAPPPNARAARAIRFALSMIGVPYSWGGASRRGVDCSGLTMLAWGSAGVALPHYSGSQMASTIRVPLYALKPGDLLFYGPGGSQHEAMYLGNRKMIEAPTFGQRVHISPIRYAGLAGAGRPRG